FLHHSSANSWQWDLHSSGSGNTLHWQQETHISQQRGFGTYKGTGSRPGVLAVPSDDSEEELSWNSSDDEDVDEKTKGREESEGDKTDESDDGSDDG
nr:hypothetical protein [Tanacetum cinerariifolium]